MSYLCEPAVECDLVKPKTISLETQRVSLCSTVFAVILDSLNVILDELHFILDRYHVVLKHFT